MSLYVNVSCYLIGSKDGDDDDDAATTKTDKDATIDDTSDSEPESWGSVDPHPRRQLLRVYESSSYILTNDIGPSNHVIQQVDFSNMCKAYREKSIRGVQQRTQLCDGRIL